MSRLVMKFGGTSVADLERIRRVARLVAAEVEARQAGRRGGLGHGRQDQRAGRLDRRRRPPPPRRSERRDDEYDVVVASGEQVTAGLLAMTLRNMGCNARSWLGWQVPIITDDAHGKARIDEVPPAKLEAALAAGEVAVIAGFQGVDARGPRSPPRAAAARDTSAVAVAAALGPTAATSTPTWTASTPPTRASRRKARRLAEDLLRGDAGDGLAGRQGAADPLGRAGHGPARAAAGAVELRRARDAAGPGTIVCDEEEIVEKRIVSGVAYSRDEAKISLFGLPDQPGVAVGDLRPPGRRQRQCRHDRAEPRAHRRGAANMEFTVGKRDAARARRDRARRQGRDRLRGRRRWTRTSPRSR